MENHFDSVSGTTRPTARPRSSARLLLLADGHLRSCPSRLRSKAFGRDPVSQDDNLGRTTGRIRAVGRGYDPTDRSRTFSASQWNSFPSEPVHNLSVRGPLSWKERADSKLAVAGPWRQPWLG